MVEQYLFPVLYYQCVWWDGMFVLVVMVVERGDATMRLAFFKYWYLTVNSVMLYCVGENYS
jgi:hypothetical protein